LVAAYRWSIVGQERWLLGAAFFSDCITYSLKIKKTEIDKFKAKPPVLPGPIVVGCFAYINGVDHSVHHTGFMFDSPTAPYAIRASASREVFIK
jgi:hypothetical protein